MTLNVGENILPEERLAGCALQRKQLTFDNETAGFPCWSPDGHWIAFEKKHGQDDYLMLIPSNGGERTQLTFGNGKSWPHSFSPSGDKIVFAGQRDGLWNIYWISIGAKGSEATNKLLQAEYVRSISGVVAGSDRLRICPNHRQYLDARIEVGQKEREVSERCYAK